jgi:hypothetical protein
MSTQSSISNWLPDARTPSILDTPTPVSLYSESSQAVLSTVNDSRVVSNVAERGDNQPSTSAYYSGLTWSKLHGSFGPTDDGVGIVRSWVWKHGWKIESLKDRKQYWLCRVCHTTAPSIKPFAIGHGTRGAIDHLKDKHQLTAQGPATKKRSIAEAFTTPSSSSTPSFQDAIDRYYPKFNPTEFKGKLLNWIISDDEAFSCLEHPQLRDMLYYLQPSLENQQLHQS